MKVRLITVTIAASLMGAAGCQTPEETPVSNTQRSISNTWMLQTYARQQVDNAILRQSTIYPHHFVHGSAVLNKLGQRDMDVLSAHFKKYPGRLNVRRGDEMPGLFQSRVEAIRAAMHLAGVQGEIVMNDLAGGDSISSQRAVVILSEADPVWHSYED